MKNNKTRRLQLAKISIATIHELNLKTIKGGTEPVSVPMSQEPDDQGVCYAIK